MIFLNTSTIDSNLHNNLTNPELLTMSFRFDLQFLEPSHQKENEALMDAKSLSRNTLYPALSAKFT